ncbi:MAG: hypothetical protein AB7V50_05720 [Vampirovibrionia bacterium]
MSRKNNRGSALVDYVVPTLVIGAIVGIAPYHLVENGTMSKFIEASVGGKVESNGVMVIK